MVRHLRGCMWERQTFFALAPICLDIRSYSQYSPGLSDDSSETAMLLFFAAALLVRASIRREVRCLLWLKRRDEFRHADDGRVEIIGFGATRACARPE